MNFYQNLGYLILGSRLRRLSEYYLAEINEVYHTLVIDFDASWFPMFYLLSQHQPISNQELADAMMVSHSAASQLISTLKKRKLVRTLRHQGDGRRLEIRLTEAGEALLQQLLPIWESIDSVMSKKLANDPASSIFLDALAATEEKLSGQALSENILKQLNERNGI